MPDSTRLTREQIADILGRHDGSKAEIARRLDINHANVSKWLVGQTVSARVAEAAEAYARELLDKEKLARGEANGPSVRKLADAIKNDDPAVKPLVEKLTKKAEE